MFKISCCAMVVVMVLASGFGFPTHAWGAIQLAEWTFESSRPSLAGPHPAEAGWFAGSSGARGSHADPAVTYSSPAGNASLHAFNSNRWAAGDGYEFTTSSVGFDNLWFAWHQTRSTTGPASFQLQIDWGDGSWNVGDPYLVPAVSWTAGSLAAASVFEPIALPPLAANVAELTLRLTALESGSSWAGTNRVDNVVLSGSPLSHQAAPEPGTLAMLALGCLTLLWRRREFRLGIKGRQASHPGPGASSTLYALTDTDLGPLDTDWRH